MSKAAKGLSLFEKARAKAKKGAKALKELEKGVSTRAGGKKAQGVEIIKGTKTRDLGKGFGLKQTGVDKSGKKVGSKMADEKKLGQRSAVISSGRKRIGAGAAAAGAGTYALTRGGAKDKTKEDTKTTTGAGKKTTTGKTTTTAKKDDGKKTFRERRLARMKKRLEGSENEGRKRRLTRRIGRVEGRIEDAKERKVKKKNMGGMMKSKMASKGGKMGGKMVRGYAKGDLVEGGVKLLQKMGQRAFEKKYGKTATNKAIKELNKISGLTPTKKPKTEKQKKLAGADSRASMTKFTKQTPAAKKQAQVKTTEKRLERGFKNGGMAKKGYSKGGAARKSKPRGVGAALRGYGKAMR